MSAVKNHKNYLQYDYGEPPEKKIQSDGDLLIKQLLEKQQNRKINLKEQLLHPKRFEKSAELTFLTNYQSGKFSLNKFEKATEHLEKIEKFKAAGLSDDDIQLMLHFQNGNLYNKHKNFEQTLLKIRIDKLLGTLKEFDDNHDASDSVTEVQSRHKAEFGLSVKPESTETKLLKFALQNVQKSKIQIPHPMDNIKEMEKHLFEHLNSKPESPVKIQKKLRKLANKISKLGEKPNETLILTNTCNNTNIMSYVKNSKWDKREPGQELYSERFENVKPKTFTCKPCNYYTVKDGHIIKLTNAENKTKVLEVLKHKLSIDAIKKSSKFGNYEIGIPSKTLYAKNLPRSIKEADLKNIFSNYNKNESLSFRTMTGRMKGQAFITFPDVHEATTALEDINGTVIGEKPVVLEYGRNRNEETN